MKNFLLVVFLLGLNVPYAAGGFSEYRARVRDWVISRSSASPKPAVGPAVNDLAADLVDKLEVVNLAEMERQGLNKAELPESPWTDYYWPTYAGQIANRYADPNFNAAMLWKYNQEYLLKNVGLGGSDLLSPAEKYDLLVGDSEFGLTRRMINAGAPYADAEGRVETWFGLCHGWAPASFTYQRPTRAVKVISAQGKELIFTPSDLKALATLLWANAGGETKFVGGRCEEKNVALDGDERETNPDCFDSNPATWHLAVVNQIARSKRSFVMDISAGQEVWNQPVFGYQYDYVNPNTNKWARRLAEAKVPREKLKNDRFRRYRSADTAAVVRIAMSVSYVAETNPSASPVDSPENDRHKLISFVYDLELDEHDNIVGGEWRGNAHPDFLWLPAIGAKAVSAGDSWLNRTGDRSIWEIDRPVPRSWATAAKKSAARDQPLARIVDRLFELSAEKIPEENTVL